MFANETKTNDIIAKLYAQAGTEISANDPQTEILNVFDGGKTIAELTKLHQNYSEKHGRIYPLYDEDDRSDASDTEGIFDPLIEDIAYHWDSITYENIKFVGLAYHYSELCNAISDLGSHHPDYNVNNGMIENA